MAAVLIKNGEQILSAICEGPDHAPALLLSNSLGTNLSLWQPQMAALLMHFKVIRYDQRGHGASSIPTHQATFDELGNDALAVLDHFNVKHAHVMGISMGGMTALWLAINAPRRVNKIVVANSSSLIPRKDLWNTRIETVSAKGMAPIVEGVLSLWFTENFRNSDPKTLDKMRQMVASNRPLGYTACCAAVRDMDLREGLAKIKAPTLVLGGAYDPATPFAMSEEIAAGIPHAILKSIEAAHISNWEKPEIFTRTTIDFLTSE